MQKEPHNIGQRRATLAVEVRSEIERMIVDGELVAGEKLNELVLANAMGVSRGTVREAIRSLVDSGLIDLIANRGAFVHEMTLEEVRNLYELRGAIFAMACASAARRVANGADRGLVKRLKTNLERMHAAEEKDNAAAYYDLNIEFHDLLVDGAANAKAKTIYDNIVKEMHLFRRKGLSVASNIARSLEEHERITEAVAAGDSEAARAAAMSHITSGMARYFELVEQGEAMAS